MMIVLSKNISKWASRWTQIKRVGLLAIYKQVGLRGKANEGATHFNVVIIRERPAAFAGLTPAREALPCNSEWGIYGWTYTNEREARRQFDHLLSEGKDKKNS